jgi:hypothetical protein
LQVLALRMAPDGIRAAFLVHTADGNRLLLAAVRTTSGVTSFGPAVSLGTGLSKASSIAWYDPYNLVVLANGAIYEVPLTGGAGHKRPLAGAPTGAQSITTNGSELVVGISNGQLRSAANFYTFWNELAKGSGPAYPG